MHRPDTPTGWVIDLGVEEAVVLEEEDIVLFLGTHPDVFGLNHHSLDVIQELPDLTQVIDDLGCVIRAVTDEQPTGKVMLHLE